MSVPPDSLLRMADQRAARPRPESVVLGRDPEVLQGLLESHAAPGALVVDATANSRKMWRGVEHACRVVHLDVDPKFSPDVVGDFLRLPVRGGAVDVLVWDPPHLPVAAGSERSHKGMKSDYGLARSVHGDNVAAYFAPFLLEARRVLSPDGVLLAKLKDYVHNHRYQWMLVDFVNAVRSTDGLTACDIRIKRDPCGGNLKSGRWKNAHHARQVHSWWIVVRRGGCEPGRGRSARGRRGR